MTRSPTTRLRTALILVSAAAASLTLSGSALGATTVPGHTGKKDADGNGYPDAGVTVVGHYESVYASDASGAWYWDLGDGREQGTVDSVDELDPATLSVCDYVVNYKGSFENDPFLDTGHIDNNIRCYGYDGKATYRYQIVHRTDPRYRGNPEWSVWGSWEYHVLTESGNGNLVRPRTHTG